MEIKVNFEDDRGTITDLLVDENIDAITLITSKCGTTRANHFHKFTTQWTYVLEGEIQYFSFDLNTEIKTEKTLTAGMIIRSDPEVAHAIKSISESKILIFTRGPRSGESYESDTFRLEEPLIQ